MRRIGWLMLFVLGCGSGKDDSAAAACGGPLCPVHFDECSDDAVPLVGGGCRTIGVPADACGAGFRHDGAGGCSSVLPETTCEKGSMAVPGEVTCREIVPCGDLPTGAGVVRVDGAYTGGSSDGSDARPFTTIQAAVAAASTGQTVAIADGVYPESVVVTRAMTLVGRCPAKVEIRGSGTRTIALRAAATLRGVAISGSGQGVTIDGVGARLDRVWVHDTSGSGVAVFAPGKDVIISDSLIESTKATGVYVEGASLLLDKSVVRDVPSSTTGGSAVQAQISRDGVPATVTVKGSVLERAGSSGVTSYGSDVRVEGSALRSLGGRKDASACVLAQAGSASPRPPSLTIIGSVLESCTAVGVRVDRGTLTFEKSSLRGVEAASDGRFGLGIDASRGTTLAIRDSLVANTAMAGILIGASTATIERTVVRDVAPQFLTRSDGMGIVVLREVEGEAQATIEQCAIVRTHTVGIFVSGGSASIARSAVKTVEVQESTGTYGDGIEVAALFDTDTGVPAPATISVFETAVTGVPRAGVGVLSAAASLERSSLRCAGVDLAVVSSFETPDGKKLQGPFALEDRGGNACGCAEVAGCHAQTTTLEPAQFIRD